MTTIETITDERIEQWQVNAASAGDLYAAAVCLQALDRSYDHVALTDAERAKVDALTCEQAKAIVVGYVRDAEAQADA